MNGGGIRNNNDSVMLRMLDLLHKKEEALERRDAEIQRLLDIIERGQGR